MTKKNRLIVAGAVFAVLAGAVVYLNLPDKSGAMTAADAANLEAINKSSEAAQAAEPPATFTEPAPTPTRPNEALKSGGATP